MFVPQKSCIIQSSGLKYIISGIPSSGKTTLINALEKKGYPVISEVSRQVIQIEQNEQNNGVPWGDVERFTELVFCETKKRLKENKEALFCDRGLIDNMAYLLAAGKKIPQYLKLFPFKQFYHKCVFFAPPWKAIYTNDEQRPETFETNLKLNEWLLKFYKQEGFEVIKLPFDSVQNRLQFVCNHIQKLV